jgi:putative ABC transport system substrate-binding protein
MIRRRDVLTLLGGGVAGWPISLAAQGVQVPVVGFLSSRSRADSTRLVSAFLGGLAEAGFITGQSVEIEYRWAEGEYEQLASMANGLAERKVAVIVAVGGAASAEAAKKATSTIPIVFSIGPDPVRLGLVQSFNRPGGNITGMSLLTTALEAKRFGLLHELVPGAALVVALVNPDNPPSEDQARQIQEAAKTINQQIRILRASNEEELNVRFGEIVKLKGEALLVAADPFFDTQRDGIVRLAAQHQIPALYQFREYAAAGGLASYGIDIVEAYHQVGIYAARILKGTRPADLPIMQPTKFQFVINLRTARALGIIIPPTLLARADEVIE